MRSITTGMGLAILGACVLGAAFIASPRFGQQAFAQVTGDRRIVSMSVYGQPSSLGGYTNHFAYRIWSDNNIEVKFLGSIGGDVLSYMNFFPPPSQGNGIGWRTVDNGLSSFVPADVDANGTVDTGDVSNVLLDFGATQAGNPPPPIDCTINAPR